MAHMMTRMTRWLTVCQDPMISEAVPRYYSYVMSLEIKQGFLGVTKTKTLEN